MENFDKVLNLQEVSLNSSGSAMEKFNIYQESTAAKMAELTVAFETLATSTVDSGFVKWLIGAVTSLLNFMNATTGLIPPLLLLAGILSRKIFGDFAFGLISTVKMLKDFGTAMQMAKDVGLTGMAALNSSMSTLAAGTDSLTAKFVANAIAWAATPMGMGILIGGAVIAGSIALFNALNVTIEEQTKIVEKATESYNSAKSKLEEINAELKTTTDRINTLNSKNSKENLTFVEEGELQRLKDITAELLIQEDIASRQEQREFTALAKEQATLYEKQFEGQKFSIDEINAYILDAQITGNNAMLVANKNNINAMLAAYSQFSDLKEEALSNYDEAKKIGADTSFYESDIEHFTGILSDLESQLFDQVPAIQKVITSIESIPEEKRIEIFGEDWQQKLENANTGIELIYQLLDPAKWKEIQFSKILNLEEFKDVKSTLEELANSGILTAEALDDPKYASFVEKMNKIGVTIEDIVNQFFNLEQVAEKVDLSFLYKSFATLREEFISGETDSKKYVDSLKDQLKTIDRLLEANPQLASSYAGIKESIELAISTAPSMLEELSKATNNLVKSADTLSSAFAEQKEKGKLYAATILSLVDAGYASALSIDNETGAVTLNKEAYLALANAKIAEQLISLQTKRTDLIKKLDDERRTVEGLTKVYSMLGNAAVNAALKRAMATAQTTEDAISNIKAEEAVLNDVIKNMPKITSGEYDSSGKSSQSSKEADKWLEAYKEAYEELQHLRAMDIINDQQYYDRLMELDKKYFGNNKKYISDHRKNLEEMYQLQKTISDARLSDIQHEITMLENQNEIITEQVKQTSRISGRDGQTEFQIFREGNYEKQIELLKLTQKELHNTAEVRRELLRGYGYSSENIELDDEIQKMKESWWDAEKSITSIQKEQIDKRLEQSENYIQLNEDYNSWMGDSASQAYKRILIYLEDYHNKAMLTDKEYYDLRQEYTKKFYNSLEKEMDDYTSRLETSVNKMLNSEKKRVEENRKYLQSQMKETEAFLKIEEGRLDVTNQIAQAEREISTVLKVNKESYKYLDEELRKTIFNEKDYDVLSKKLKGINKEAETLYQDYWSKISGLTVDNAYMAEYITNEYERQNNLLLQQYKIA